MDVDSLTNELLANLSVGKPKKQSSLDDEFDLPPPPNFDDLIIGIQTDEKSNEYSVPSGTATSVKPAPPVVAPKPKKSKSSISGEPNPVPDSNSDINNTTQRPSVPADLSTNAESELDYYTKTLLANMANPSDDQCYGYCDICKKVVEGEQVGCRAFGKVYHIACFVCVGCSKPLHGIEFYGVDNQPYCTSCYLESLEKCVVCGKAITERILRASGKAYHPECFKCCSCEKILDGCPFAADDDNNVYCVDCYHDKFAPKCAVCGKPILPDEGKEESLRIVLMGKDYHVGCFKCEICGELLSGEGRGCYPLDGKLLCLKCNTESINKLVK